MLDGIEGIFKELLEIQALSQANGMVSSNYASADNAIDFIATIAKKYNNEKAKNALNVLKEKLLKIEGDI
ncbi:MAG: hypothetical protein GY679_02090 [Mycoplasma sp.]|nr:hypothetical protein [Mycoplasma sp.]